MVLPPYSRRRSMWTDSSPQSPLSVEYINPSRDWRSVSHVPHDRDPSQLRRSSHTSIILAFFLARVARLNPSIHLRASPAETLDWPAHHRTESASWHKSPAATNLCTDYNKAPGAQQGEQNDSSGYARMPHCNRSLFHSSSRDVRQGQSLRTN